MAYQIFPICSKHERQDKYDHEDMKQADKTRFSEFPRLENSKSETFRKCNFGPISLFSSIENISLSIRNQHYRNGHWRVFVLWEDLIQQSEDKGDS